MTVTLDYSHMMAGNVPAGFGITREQWSAGAAAFASAHAAVAQLHANGTLGFMDLPRDHAMLERVQSLAAQWRGEADDVLLLGIGGSALGPIALRSALCPPHWNELSVAERGGGPRLHVLDNVDPRTITAVLARLSLPRTLVVVISKSGGTVETMAQYLMVHEAMTRAMGAAAAMSRCVFITDPAVGALRAIARAEGVTTLDIPPNVGGRFSVLSPVGLFPAALLGIDIGAMLRGAARCASQCNTPDVLGNPAGAFAVLQWIADTQHGATIQALMPYSDALRDVSAWFVQLWAESLGKQRLDGVHVGPTPIPALGATDQHAQVQLFMEGPRNKTVTFVAVDEAGDPGIIPSLHGDIPELAYLGGHTLAELLDIERRATAGALAASGRLNATLHLPRVDVESVGGLLYLLELATAYAGALYGVDAFNQPGVELGKHFAYAMLGRPGSEAARARWEEISRGGTSYRVG